MPLISRTHTQELYTRATIITNANILYFYQFTTKLPIQELIIILVLTSCNHTVVLQPILIAYTIGMRHVQCRGLVIRVSDVLIQTRSLRWETDNRARAANARGCMCIKLEACAGRQTTGLELLMQGAVCVSN